MINEIYNDKILEYAASISRIGRLNDPDATSKKYGRLCGSTVIVDLKIKNDIVIDFAHEIHACALGQAAASILANHVIGQNTQNLKILRRTIRDMLTKNGPPPSIPLEAFSCLQPIKNYKERHASTMLIFDAVIDCIQ
ncbi:iron-sulfur cluster assembly scaffold protein [Bartonella sp. F02]|uniref:iron-sulfur cluster assembly scaffold protein n=1 Tax=Bartonella sp. F02 TaxID=2967262 RepID=UPI0022A9A4A2|nr:iron-sulfur cluster assembly scaffold protein [Bartonella sp. F02]MCZ2328309.1 iron-sulfur cluster assembly scaffold protein [Bartonella sp. F02]